MASATVVRDLEGKVALVTGATSGIGRAAAVQLAAQGATVIVHGRDGTRGGAVVAEIENAGGSAWFVDAELSEPAEALRLAEEVGDVDILVNNAGFPWFGPSEELPADTLQRLFAANVQAPYLLASVLAPKMVARGDGVIINVASRAGTRGRPDSAAYGATKAALTSFARSWAAEYGPAGIRVNAVSPGPVYTNAAKRELFDVWGKTTPLGRAGEAQEIAEVIGFLASPRASYITGHQHRRRRRQHRRLTPPQTETPHHEHLGSGNQLQRPRRRPTRAVLGPAHAPPRQRRRHRGIRAIAADTNSRLGPFLMFHTVPEGQTVKNRGDFDLQAADVAAEADRLTRLGASRSAHWTTVSSLADWPATLDRSAPTPPKREMLLSKGVAS